jgi:glycosyltransferase involved in cell wall biosynthesis
MGMKRYLLKIARVLSPRIQVSSARASLLPSSFDQEWISQEHKITTFVYSKQKRVWLDTRDFYISEESVLWLSSLAFSLIKGKFHLFVTGTAAPEHIITFIISKLLRKPIIIVDTHWFWPKTMLAKLLWPMGKLIAQHATVFSVVGQRSRKFWNLSGISDKRINIYHIYYSTIDVRHKHITRVKQLRKRLGDKRIILYLGRLIRRKGVEFLIKSFAKLSDRNKNVLLLIVGDGPERNSLEKLCKEFGLNNVVFSGAVYDEEMKATYFFLSDIFVYPSTSIGNFEEWGLTVNEAMSAGKPVIVTNAVGCAYDLVKHGVNGYIIPERDIEALYLALKTLVDNSHLRIKMGKASKKITQDFTYYNAQKSLDEIIKLAYKNICKP